MWFAKLLGLNEEQDVITRLFAKPNGFREVFS